MLLIIAGDAHRTTGGRSNHNPYLIENPISPEAVLEKEFILAFIPPVRRKTWKSIITRLRLDRTVLQYPSIWKASILVLCSYLLSTPSPSFSSINPTASLHSSLWFQPLASQPLTASACLLLLGTSVASGPIHRFQQEVGSDPIIHFPAINASQSL